MSDQKLKVLFICAHNSGRSIMAEAFLREISGDTMEVDSAGLEPAPAVNPLVVRAMAEVGHDVSGKKPKSVFELYKAGKLYDYVITVCDETDEAKCPVFPGVTHRWSWPFPDPAALEGDEDAKLEQVRAIRDAIHKKMEKPFG